MSLLRKANSSLHRNMTAWVQLEVSANEPDSVCCSNRLQAVCHCPKHTCFPVSTSHNTTVLSKKPDARYLPFRDQHSDVTAVEAAGRSPSTAALGCTLCTDTVRAIGNISFA